MSWSLPNGQIPTGAAIAGSVSSTCEGWASGKITNGAGTAVLSFDVHCSDPSCSGTTLFSGTAGSGAFSAGSYTVSAQFTRGDQKQVFSSQDSAFTVVQQSAAALVGASASVIAVAFVISRRKQAK